MSHPKTSTPRGAFLRGGLRPQKHTPWRETRGVPDTPEPDDLPEIRAVMLGSLYRAENGTYWRSVTAPEGAASRNRWQFQSEIPAARYKAITRARSTWGYGAGSAGLLIGWVALEWLDGAVLEQLLAIGVALFAIAIGFVNITRYLQFTSRAVPVDAAGDLVEDRPRRIGRRSATPGRGARV